MFKLVAPSTKYERQHNDFEYGNITAGVYGRKFDLMIRDLIFDDSDLPENI